MKCPYCGSSLVGVCDCCEKWRCFSCGRHLTEAQIKKEART
jgi:transposase-like protein